MSGIAFVVTGLAFAVVPACSSDSTGEDEDATEPSQCKDGKKNGDETGKDCGGSCKKCKGESCKKDADCKNGTCESGKCISTSEPSPPAENGQKDNEETDVDCGGPNAPPCGEGKGCLADTDCVDKYCREADKKCTAPRNDDGVKNGTETDVDCGGESGKKCAEGLACVADTDCNGACSYTQKCVDTKSCKPHFGGDTCGTRPLWPGEPGDAAGTMESCCRSLPVPGYSDPKYPGKQVYLDKYEITAGRVRAFIEALSANGGAPDVKAWVAANPPPVWDPSFNQFLPSGAEAAIESVPHKPTSGAEPAPWFRNMGTSFAFGGELYVYVHGHNCYQGGSNAYGFPTYWYPDDVQAKNGGNPRVSPFDANGGVIPAKDILDSKTMTCIPNAVLAAFCHWDGGQLATDEVLDFVTGAPASLGNSAGCGPRCAAPSAVQRTSDSGQDNGIYFFPYYPAEATHEGVSRIASPGRVSGDVVRINAGDEPWMDIRGNVEEVVLDMSGATFTGKFGLKYEGIGYSSSRAINNPTALTYPEYKAAYSGGRCMRFK